MTEPILEWHELEKGDLVAQCYEWSDSLCWIPVDEPHVVLDIFKYQAVLIGVESQDLYLTHRKELFGNAYLLLERGWWDE